MEGQDGQDEVYGPDVWRELNAAPAESNVPAEAKYPCAAVKNDGEICRNKAIYGTPFCSYHGGTTITAQNQAKRRIEAVKATLFDRLVKAAGTAVDAYIEICKSGEKDSDRLKAADRILELVGIREDIVSVHVSGTTEVQVSSLDGRLVEALRGASQERLSRVIDTTATDEEAESNVDADG